MRSVCFDLIMNALAPLLGVLIMSAVLVGNFFRTAWRLGILRSFGRRHPVTWRTLAAGAMAACLPFAGVLVTLILVPSDNDAHIDMSAWQLALELAGSGLLMHLLNDQIMLWAKPPTANA
jgi:hypothetical protein